MGDARTTGGGWDRLDSYVCFFVFLAGSTWFLLMRHFDGTRLTRATTVEIVCPPANRTIPSPASQSSDLMCAETRWLVQSSSGNPECMDLFLAAILPGVFLLSPSGLSEPASTLLI